MENNENYFDYESPVTRLKEGLTISELIKKHESVFEVAQNEEEDGPMEGTNPESCFSFEELQKVTNLDVMGRDEEDEGDNNYLSPFDRYRLKMHDLRDDGKLKKYVVKPGFGPQVPENSIVYIRYQGHVEYAEIPFDSTVWQCHDNQERPVPINLGRGEVLPGLHEALLSMKKGEKAEFLIDPDLAYGKLGCPPRVPPDATVLFIVEVDRFVDCGDALLTDDDLSYEERTQYRNVIKIAKSNNALGNDIFSKGNFNAAVNKYRNVINMLHNSRLANEEEENERNHYLVKNYTNACVCYHKLKKYNRVCSMAADAVKVNSAEALKNHKLMYFWGYAKMMLDDYDSAKRHLLTAKNLKPSDREILNALTELERRKQHNIMQERIMAQRAFGFTPSTVTITEVNDAQEEFRNTIVMQLNEFKEDPDRRVMHLRDPLTTEEEKLWLQIALDMQLYARVIDGTKRTVRIQKPDEM